MASKRRIGSRMHEQDGSVLSPLEADQRIYGTVRPIKLDEITIDPEIQVRAAGLDEDRVEQYVEFLLSGGSFKDPIVVFQDGENLLLSAGFHRAEAYRRAIPRFEPSDLVPGLADLRAEIRQGGRSGAIEFAEEDNLAHGLELSDQDKYNILARRYKRSHQWVGLSDRAIAARLGVAHTTVGRWRKKIAKSTGARAPVEGEKRISADGKVRDVSGIQEANQRRAEERELQAAIEQEQAERWARGTHFDQRKTEEREAILDQMRQSILKALAGGPLRALELRAALGDPATEPFRLAREQLKQQGLLVEEMPPGGRVTYHLASVSVNSTQIQPDLDSVAHSDDHDSDLDAAYRTVAVFNMPITRADESIRKLLEVRGIRALYALPEDRMKQLYGDLSVLRNLAQELVAYCDLQLERLRFMARAGQPYDEEDGP